MLRDPHSEPQSPRDCRGAEHALCPRHGTGPQVLGQEGQAVRDAGGSSLGSISSKSKVVVPEWYYSPYSVGFWCFCNKCWTTMGPALG